MPLARVDLESLLRTRHLDRTLTTALPPLDPRDEAAMCAVGRPFLGRAARRRVPARSALGGGRFAIVRTDEPHAADGWRRRPARGELVALVDALDMFDVESASAAGVDLDRLLWIRGHVVSNPGLCRDINQRALEQAIRAFTLVLQAGNFGLVIFDAAEAPAEAIRRLPFTTWLRLQRMVEGSQTMALLVGGEPMARSSAGLTLRVGVRDSGFGIRPPSPLRMSSEPMSSERVFKDSASKTVSSGFRFGPQLFEGLTVEARVVRARVREREEATATFSTVASDCA